MMLSESEREAYLRLYRAAGLLSRLAPWQWMEETDIFGVRCPESGHVGFVSVMGSLGKHLAASVYLGEEGIYGFWGVESDPSDDSDHIVEVPHLTASFEDRELTYPEDRALAKELGLTFRGKHAWPMFRSFRPGYFPWFLEPDEVRFLTVALEQTLGVAMRFEDDPSFLDVSDPESYLVRVPRQDAGQVVWDEEVLHVPPPDALRIDTKVSVKALKRLAGLPAGSGSFELDSFITPARVGAVGARPACTYAVILVDSKSGFILGQELMMATEGLPAMWAELPDKVIGILAESSMVPAEIRVRSNLLFQLLQPLTERLHVKLTRTQSLPAVEEARVSLFEFFGQAKAP